MNKYITSTVAALSALLLTACGTTALADAISEIGMPSAPPSGSASEPTLGYIVYSGKSQGKQNIYRQDMIGMAPSGAPVTIYEEDYANTDGSGDGRYPQVTPDGRYIVFITRKTDGIVGSGGGIDQLVIMDHQGTEWTRRTIGTQYCQNVNYPEIITYQYNADFSQTDFEIITMCADQWPPVSMHAYHIGPSANYFDTQGELEQMPVGEYALLPGYTAADGGYILAARGDELLFTKYEHNQPGPDKGDTGQVHINAASRYDGGICPLDLSPCPVVFQPPLKNVFAPSISPDGKYLAFNSEVYSNTAGRGEEFFILDLPTTDLLQAYSSTWGNPIDPGYLSQINDMAHANNADNHYGTFTVNGLHQYALHGDGDLQVAPDLTSTPVLVPSPNIEVWETGWFYKD